MAEKTGQVLQIRTNEELAAKFKQVSEELEIPYGPALELLIQAYDVGKFKESTPERAKEIEEVETITRRFLEIYKNALQLNKTSEESIKEGFLKQLSTRDQLIETLKTDIDEAKTEKEAAVNAKQEIEQTLAVIREGQENEKELLQSYKERIDSLSGLLAEHKEFKTDNIKLKEEISALSAANIRNEKELSAAAEKIRHLEDQHVLAIEKLENKHIAEINKLNKSYQDKIYEIREDYNRRLLEQFEKSPEK
jgi:predicted  nucleic acid-binding Zn-ribbon protein